MKTIAVIDDDIHIGNLLEEVLRGAGYNVVRAYSGTEAVMLLSRHRVELVLLDLMLPGLSGEEVLARTRGIPVIVVSAKADVQDKVKLLLGGAVDYMTKPFNTDELLARVAVNMNKGGASGADGILEIGELALDAVSHGAKVCGRAVHLTPTEYAILKLLMQNSGRVIAKSVILDRISEDTLDCTENSLRQHMSNLRKKLRETGGREYIEAVWGIGFKLES
jgi:two-component system OmpR family response regulator